MNGRRIILLFALATALAAGCEQSASSAPPIGSDRATTGAAAAPSPAPTSAIATAPTSALPTAPTSAHLYDPGADARADIASALAAARTDGKRVILDFGADWCPDCHVLAEYLEAPAARALLDARFDVVRIDVGHFDRNMDLAKQYGNAVAVGIPSFALLDSSGTVLHATSAGELATSALYTATDVLALLTSWAQ